MMNRLLLSGLGLSVVKMSGGMKTIKAALSFIPWAPLAILELAWARIRFAKVTPARILAQNARIVKIAGGATQTGLLDRSFHIARASFLIPRVAAFLPWRADCLVQAIAGQHWLARKAIASEIEIGVRHAQNEFCAHAWLVVNGVVVLGGDTECFSALLSGSEGREAASSATDLPK